MRKLQGAFQASVEQPVELKFRVPRLLSFPSERMGRNTEYVVDIETGRVPGM